MKPDGAPGGAGNPGGAGDNTGGAGGNGTGGTLFIIVRGTLYGNGTIESKGTKGVQYRWNNIVWGWRKWWRQCNGVVFKGCINCDCNYKWWCRG